MTFEYSVEFAERARQDMRNTTRYIRDELASPIAARNWLALIYKRTRQLAIFPNSGALAEEPFLSGRGYRKLVIKNFLALYLVEEEKKRVVIMRVTYGAVNLAVFDGTE